MTSVTAVKFQSCDADERVSVCILFSFFLSCIWAPCSMISPVSLEITRLFWGFIWGAESLLILLEISGDLNQGDTFLRLSLLHKGIFQKNHHKDFFFSHGCCSWSLLNWVGLLGKSWPLLDFTSKYLPEPSWTSEVLLDTFRPSCLQHPAPLPPSRSLPWGWSPLYFRWNSATEMPLWHTFSPECCSHGCFWPANGPILIQMRPHCCFMPAIMEALEAGRISQRRVLEHRLTIRCEEAFKMEILAVHWWVFLCFCAPLTEWPIIQE